jgi:hypothetical protein
LKNKRPAAVLKTLRRMDFQPGSGSGFLCLGSLTRRCGGFARKAWTN